MPMITRIDIQQSIFKRKLVFKMNAFDRAFGFYIKFFLATIFPFFTVAYTVQHPDLLNNYFGDQAIAVAVIVNVAVFAFSYLIIKYFRNPTRLLKVSGQSLEDNKALAVKVLKEMSCSIEIEQDGVIIATPHSISNRQLTIIFNRNDIFISSLSFGRNQGMMVYHPKAAELFVKTFRSQNQVKVWKNVKLKSQS